jgi:hypothetical protein
MPHLELYPHHRSPLNVVGLGEGRPPAAGADVPDDSLVLVVTTVSNRGERAMSPVKAALSVDPSAATVCASSRSATAVHASSRSTASVSASVWVVAALVRGCPLRRSPSCCLPFQQLEARVGAVISSDGAAVAAAQNLDLRCCCTRCICRCHCRCFHLRSGCCQLRRCQP